MTVRALCQALVLHACSLKPQRRHWRWQACDCLPPCLPHPHPHPTPPCASSAPPAARPAVVCAAGGGAAPHPPAVCQVAHAVGAAHWWAWAQWAVRPSRVGRGGLCPASVLAAAGGCGRPRRRSRWGALRLDAAHQDMLGAAVPTGTLCFVMACQGVACPPPNPHPPTHPSAPCCAARFRSGRDGPHPAAAPGAPGNERRLCLHL